MGSPIYHSSNSEQLHATQYMLTMLTHFHQYNRPLPFSPYAPTMGYDLGEAFPRKG